MTRSYDEMVALVGKAKADELLLTGKLVSPNAPKGIGKTVKPQAVNQTIKMPLTPDERLATLGKNAQKVWTFLQAAEQAFLRSATAAGLANFVTVEQIAHATGMPQGTVANTVVMLATNGLVSRITADGKVAA